MKIWAREEKRRGFFREKEGKFDVFACFQLIFCVFFIKNIFFIKLARYLHNYRCKDFENP